MTQPLSLLLLPLRHRNVHLGLWSSAAWGARTFRYAAVPPTETPSMQAAAFHAPRDEALFPSPPADPNSPTTPPAAGRTKIRGPLLALLTAAHSSGMNSSNSTSGAGPAIFLGPQGAALGTLPLAAGRRGALLPGCYRGIASSSRSQMSLGKPCEDKTVARSPLSKAVALLVSRDHMQRDQLVAAMGMMSTEFLSDIETCSPTEVATFCEVARKMEFCTQALADAVINYFRDRCGELNAEELPGVLWMVAERDDIDTKLARDLSEAVHKLLPELRHEDLPMLITAMAAICPADPFLLGELSQAVMEQLKGFTASEVVALVEGYGREDVRRSFFDDNVFKGLAVAVIARLPEFTNPQLGQIMTVYRNVAQRHANLAATLTQLEAKATQRTDPTPE